MTVRILLSSAVVGAALLSAACAGGPPPANSYSAEMDRLDADCRARDGILAPIPGAATGRPQTDYVCEIRGGGTRIRN